MEWWFSVGVERGDSQVRGEYAGLLSVWEVRVRLTLSDDVRAGSFGFAPAHVLGSPIVDERQGPHEGWQQRTTRRVT